METGSGQAACFWERDAEEGPVEGLLWDGLN